MRIFLVVIIVSILSSIIFFIAKKKAKKIEKEMNANDFIIRQPKASLILYIVVASLALLAFLGTFLTVVEHKDIFIVLIFLPVYFFVFGPFFIIIWIRWKMIIKDKQITYTSYFGKKKTFTFDYITKVKYGTQHGRMGKIDYIKAYHEKKKLFYLSNFFPGFNILFQRLKDEGVAIAC